VASEFEKGIEELLVRIGTEVANEAKDIAPIRSGNLKNDIQPFFNSVKYGIVEVGNTKATPYAKYVYYGTSPYTITPKKKKALKTPYGVFKKVHHPGIKANPYLDIGVSNYVRSGGLKRAIDSANLEKKVVKDLKLDEFIKALK